MGTERSSPRFGDTVGAPRKNPQKEAKEIIQHQASLGAESIGIASKLGVSVELYESWLIDYPDLQHAFYLGREEQRQQLHAAVLKAAKAGITAGNRNAMYLLSTKFGYRKVDQAQINIDASTTQTVMVVKDHGTDAEWEAKAAEQQRKLTLNAATCVPLLAVPAEIDHSFIEAPSWQGIPSWHPDSTE